MASTDGVICTELEEIHQAPWVAGRVALIGDAAHAISPGMGQGAGMAMEDAAVLAQALGSAPSAADALVRFEGRRRARVETIGRLSRAIIERGQLTNPVQCWLRNRRVQRDGRSVERMQATLAQLLAWPRPEGGDA